MFIIAAIAALSLYPIAQESREKWRNIRSAFVRSLKLQAEYPSKMKKPYYLIDYLQFVLPYVKPASVSMRKQAVEADSFLTGQMFESITVLSSEGVKEEYEDVSSGDEDYLLQMKSPLLDKSPSGSPQNHETEELSHSSVADKRQVFSSRKRALPQDPEEMSGENSRAKTTNKPHAGSTCVQREPARSADLIPTMSPMQHFFMCCLPEFDTMTEQQKRHFKIRTLILIDQMKNSQIGRTYTGTYDSAAHQ